MSRLAKLDSTLTALVLALAAWAVLAAVVLATLAPLGALMSPGAGPERPGTPRPASYPGLARAE